jgi:hypothetical protein
MKFVAVQQVVLGVGCERWCSCGGEVRMGQEVKKLPANNFELLNSRSKTESDRTLRLRSTFYLTS